MPATTLILRPSNWYSRGKPVTASSELSATYYPKSLLVDGSGRRAYRSNAATGTVDVDLEAVRTPNIFGVCNNNFDRGSTVSVQAGSSAGASDLLNTTLAARFPCMLLDLRPFAVSARYWRLGWSGQSRNPSIGEIVIGLGDEYDGCLDPEFAEELISMQERAEFESFRPYVSFTGQIARSMPLHFTMTQDERDNMAELYEECGLVDNQRYVIVPDTQKNDLWLAELPPFRGIGYPLSEIELTHELPVIEEGFGVLQ